MCTYHSVHAAAHACSTHCITHVLPQARGLPGCVVLSAAARQRLREQAPLGESGCVDLGVRNLRGRGTMSVYMAKVGLRFFTKHFFTKLLLGSIV